MNTFYVEISTGPALITKEEIWPDGDGPENPTKHDVENRIYKESGASPLRGWGLFELAGNWNLDDNAYLEVMDGIREDSAAVTGGNE